MWLIRNRLYFELGLAERDDVHLVSYNDFLAAPPAVMSELCSFLDFPYRDDLVAHVAPRPATYTERLDIHPRVREQCDELAEQLAQRLDRG
jgi:hypothetical protein